MARPTPAANCPRASPPTRTAGNYSVTASTSGASTPATFSLTNNNSAPASIAATSGSPQSVTVNTAGSALVATVDDQYGNPVANVSVTFTAPTSGASGLFSNSTATISGTTNASGQISESYTANTTAGSYGISAVASGVSSPVKFYLTNTASTAASIAAASGASQNVTVNTLFGSSLVATVDDQYGNPVPGVSVTFTAPSSGAGGLFSNSTATISGTTNTSGQVSEAFTANTVAGSYSVTASTSGANTPASFSLTNAASTAASIAATSGSGQSVTVTSALTSSLTATVDDQYGNPVSGVSVTFTAPSSGAGGLFSNSSNTIIGTTDSNGQISEAFTANMSAGSYSISAAANGVKTPATFSLTNAAGAAASIASTSGTSQSVIVTTAFSVLTATVDDVYGNPVPGASVTFTSPSSGASGLFGNSTITISGTTNASGQLSEAFTANTAAGVYNVTASTSGASTPATFSLTNTFSTAASITAASGSSQSSMVLTTFGSVLTATVDDAYGNPVEGASVTFTAPSSGAGGLFSNSLATISGKTDVSGQISESFTANTHSGSYSISAAANGVSPPATFSLTNTSSTPVSIAVASGSPQSVTVNTAASAALVATVDDVYGNPVPGAVVTFTAPASGASGIFSNTTLTITGTTDANGQLSEAFTGTAQAGSYLVTASTTGVKTPATFSLTNTASIPASIVAASGTPQSATVNTAYASPFVVTVDDANNNPVAGVKVTFTAPSSGASGLFSNSTTTISALTNSSGQVAETFTANTTSGGFSVTASVGGVSTPATFSLTNIGDVATHFVVNAAPTAMLGVPSNFTVTAQDKYNNTSTIYTGTVQFSSTDVVANLPASTTLTNGVGVFSAAFNTLGNQTVTATDTATASITGVSGGITVTSPGLPFSDNFTTPTNQLSSSWTTKSGSYQVVGGAVQGLAGTNVAVVTGVSAGNLTVQANVTLGAASSPYGGVVARYSVTGNTTTYYWAGLVNTGKAIVAEVWLVVNGSVTVLNSQTISTASGAFTGTVLFQLDGSWLNLSVNGALATSADDGTLTIGAIGIRDSANATTTKYTASDLPIQDGPNAPIAASTGYDTPTFTWNSVTGAVQYELFVADNLSPQTAVFGSAKAGISVSGTAFTPTSFTPGMLQALTPGHNYTWYLGAEVASGAIFWGGPEHFSLATLSQPAQFGPSGTIAAGAGFDTPTFSWNADTGADQYYLYVLDATTNKTVVSNASVLGTSYSGSTLTPGDSFTWYLGAESTNSAAIAWSGPKSFSLAALTQPTLMGPSGTLTGVGPPPRPCPLAGTASPAPFSITSTCSTPPRTWGWSTTHTSPTLRFPRR